MTLGKSAGFSRQIQMPIRHWYHKDRTSAIDHENEGEAEMNTKKIIIAACIGLALFIAVPVASVSAQDCYYCNPLLFPLAVAGAVVGTAAAIVTAPFCPYCGPYYYSPPAPVYYGPAHYAPGPYPHHKAWVRGHYNRNGAWVPGHWRYID
jgi:hypothetical protein